MGNQRVLFSDTNGDGSIDANTEVLQTTAYYPFGMKMEGNFTQNTGRENNYLFNGKELDTDFGLNWYHYGFRMYDPAIGRFTGVDPISDKFPWVSTYNYAENEPIANIDLHGLQKLRFDPNMSFFLQYEARGSFLITGSKAIGIAVDTRGNAGLYTTKSVGGGLTLGLNTSWTAGFASADNIWELEGYGFNGGAYLTAGLVAGLSFAGEVNIPFSFNTTGDGGGWDNVDLGASIGLPAQLGIFGAGGGIYLDGSWTDFLASGNVSEMVKLMIKNAREDFGVDVTDEQRKNIENTLNSYMNNNEELDEEKKEFFQQLSESVENAPRKQGN